MILHKSMHHTNITLQVLGLGTLNKALAWPGSTHDHDHGLWAQILLRTSLKELVKSLQSWLVLQVEINRYVKDFVSFKSTSHDNKFRYRLCSSSLLWSQEFRVLVFPIFDIKIMIFYIAASDSKDKNIVNGMKPDFFKWCVLAHCQGDSGALKLCLLCLLDIVCPSWHKYKT